MPKNAAATRSGKCRRSGRRTWARGAPASRATDATASLTTDRPMTPRSGAATRIAGNAPAQSTTAARPAVSTLNLLMALHGAAAAVADCADVAVGERVVVDVERLRRLGRDL